MDGQTSSESVQIIRVQKKVTRNRSPTWTDEEIHKLFHVWSQPDIHNGYIHEARKRVIFIKISKELKKLGVSRSVEECQAKIKNLKGDYRKAKELGVPQNFKYLALIENILTPPEPSTGRVINIEEPSHNGDDDVEYAAENDDDDEFDSVDRPITIPSPEDDLTLLGIEGAYGGINQGPHQPVEIEFELMSNVDFLNMKSDELPIEIQGSDIFIPRPYPTMVDGRTEAIVLNESQGPHSQDSFISVPQHNHHHHSQLNTIVTCSEALDDDCNPLEGPDGTPLLVITTTDAGSHARLHETSNIGGNDISLTTFSGELPFSVSGPTRSQFKLHTETGSTSTATATAALSNESEDGKRKLSSNEVGQKRRKLQSISDKMSETVTRILTQTTQSLIDEMKASEERFIAWEEKRREEDQKREENMLRQLIEALQKPSSKDRNLNGRNRDSGSGSTSGRDYPETGVNDRRRLLNTIRSSEDPCAATFDLLATRLSTMLEDQTKETEQSMLEWEQKMQRKESDHTEGLFTILLNAIKGDK